MQQCICCRFRTGTKIGFFAEYSYLCIDIDKCFYFFERDIQMKGGRTGYALLVMLMASLLLCGCNKFKQIRPVSAKVESVVPGGMRSLVVNMAVEIDNPAAQLALSDIEGVVTHSGKILGRVSVDPFILEAKTLSEYHLRAKISLDEGVSLFEVMTLANEKIIDECFVDVSFKASLKGGISKKMKFEALPLRKFMNF